MKKYKIIMADPPWQYDDRAASGRRGASFKYPVMSFEDIRNLDVESISDDHCALFLWATAPMLPEAFITLQEWGFNYKTVAFTWVKRTTNNKLAWGMGNWTRANPEYVLLGTRGRPQRESASVHSVIEAQRKRHSEKPTEVHERIVQLLGDIPRIELFARNRVPGWDVWGNEVECDINLKVKDHDNEDHVMA